MQLAQTLLGRRILGLLELHFLHFKTGHLALQLIDLLRRGVELHTQVSGRLIDQIDGLVRQLTTRNVTVREGRGGNRILFDVLAVLVQRGRADQAQLATGQHGLQHIAGIHRAFGRTRADDGVDLIDEGDDLTIRILDFVEDALQALLELATVLRTGHHGA